MRHDGSATAPLTAYEQRRLPCGVPLLDDDMRASDRARISRACPLRIQMRAQQLLDRAGELDAARGQDHEVVTHAFELGDDVRREDHGYPFVGHGLHQT